MKSAIDKAMLLGPRQSLVGVLTQPVGETVDPSRPVVVILNSGVIHRVGPNRMTVALARALAARGFASLRFDLSGIGDSEPRADGLGPHEASMADIREALDSLEAARGPLRVILAGLCSGADQSAVYAGGDARVVGMVLLDPRIPRTRRYYINHYRTRFVRARSWLNFLAGRHPVWHRLLRRTRLVSQQPAEPDPVDTPEVRAALGGFYAAAVNAGVKVYAACTPDRESRINYREQLIEAFPEVPFGDQLTLDYFERADHTFSAESERQAVIARIVDWAAGTAFTR